MTPEIQLQIIQLIVVAVGVLIYAGRTFLNRVGADTEQQAAFTSQSNNNYQERRDLSESVTVLRETLSYTKGQHDEALRVSAIKIEALEKQMKELGTTYETRIKDLENEIRDLNKTIAARDETIADLKTQVKRLSETVEKFLAAQAAVPPFAESAQPENEANKPAA